MRDWRIDLVECLRGQRLVFSKYKPYSETWEHDHCLACGAKFCDIDSHDHLHEGYATGPEYPKGAEYEWVCKKCFEDLKDEIGWTSQSEAGSK